MSKEPLPASKGQDVVSIPQNNIQEFDIEDVQDQSRSTLQMVVLMIALNLSLFVAALDQTIVATAVPSISASLHSASGYTWIGSAYLLANAAAAPIWAKFSDIWGRKPILLICVAWFFVSSIVCATAKSMTVLILGRALQGVAGGGLLNVTMIVVADLFSARTRGLFIGIMELVWAFAGGLGPVLGGIFAQYSWRWIFWINLPISGLSGLLLLLFLKVHNPHTPAKEGLLAIDFLGSLCILGLTLMLLLGLDFGGVVFPWSSPKVVCLIVFGCLMGGFFFLTEKKVAKYPLMPMSLFNHRSNVACFVLTFAHGFAFNAVEYFLPLYFQSVLLSSPLHSGLYLLPVTILEALMGIFCGLVMHFTGRYRELIWSGMALMTLGMGLYIYIDADTPLATIIGFEVIEGIGAGLVFNPPLIAIQALVRQEDVATATATQGFIRTLGMAMSVVIAGVVIQNGMSAHIPQLRTAGLSDSLLAEFTGGDATANVAMIEGIRDLGQRRAVQEAFAASLRNMWILMTCVTGVGLLASAFVARTRLSSEHVETKTGLREKEEEKLSEVARSNEALGKVGHEVS